MSEYIKILVAGFGAAGGMGVVVYLLRHFTVKYFDQIKESITEHKKDGEARLTDVKIDLCKKYDNLRVDVKELYSRTDKIPVIEERLNNHISNHKGDNQ